MLKSKEQTSKIKGTMSEEEMRNKQNAKHNKLIILV
jgi:hypothetical protein